MNVHGFFSGIGGFELGFQRAGFEIKTVCEIDEFANYVLAMRFPKARNLGDIKQCSSVGSPAKTSLSLENEKALRDAKAGFGRSTHASFKFRDLIGLLQKMWATLGVGGCPNCGQLCGPSAIPLCQFECEPVTWERTTKGRESSLLPTPTASSYGSCRGGGAGRVGKWRKSLVGLGIRDAEDWEAMMGFPRGWTEDVKLSATPSSPKSRKSSRKGLRK